MGRTRTSSDGSDKEPNTELTEGMEPSQALDLALAIKGQTGMRVAVQPSAFGVLVMEQDGTPVNFITDPREWAMIFTQKARVELQKQRLAYQRTAMGMPEAGPDDIVMGEVLSESEVRAKMEQRPENKAANDA